MFWVPTFAFSVFSDRGMFMQNRTYYGENMQMAKVNHKQQRPVKQLTIL